MHPHTQQLKEFIEKKGGDYKPTPTQSLLVATIKRDVTAARAAIAAGAHPMSIMEKAIESRHGCAEFLLQLVEADCLEYVRRMAAHLESWPLYPDELSALRVWIAANEKNCVIPSYLAVER